MEPLYFDLDTFYSEDTIFTNPFCHFLYFHLGLNGLKCVPTKDKEINATPTTTDKATQTEKGNIFWSYFS